jgi:hypothetical protein
MRALRYGISAEIDLWEPSAYHLGRLSCIVSDRATAAQSGAPTEQLERVPSAAGRGTGILPVEFRITGWDPVPLGF